MFTNNQDPIAQVRRELRGKLPDSWLEDVLFVMEYGGDSIDALSIEDLLKLKVAATFSNTLKRLLDRAIAHQSQPQTHNFFGQSY